MIFVFILVIILVIISLLTFFLITYRNKVVKIKEEIENAKSKIRIIKAKYLQVLRKTTETQKISLKTQSEAYNGAVNNTHQGQMIGGAFGKINDNFDDSSSLVVNLAEEYSSAQVKLNALIKEYNVMITVFPKSIFARILKYKKEEYVDSDNLEKSKTLQGFDDKDI